MMGTVRGTTMSERLSSFSPGPGADTTVSRTSPCAVASSKASSGLTLRREGWCIQ